MRGALWGIGLALALSGTATAQTTRCANTIYGMPEFGMTCETSGGSSPPVSWRDVSPVPCNAFQRAALGPEHCGARDVAAARKKVGEQIAAGDCDAALKGALATGDLAFAREVRDFCGSPPAQ